MKAKTKVKAKELRNMKAEQLKESLITARKELMKLNSQVAVGTTPESPGRIKQVKKNIARMIMIMNENKKLQPEAKTTEGRKKL